MKTQPQTGSAWLYLLQRWRRISGQNRIRLSTEEAFCQTGREPSDKTE